MTSSLRQKKKVRRRNYEKNIEQFMDFLKYQRNYSDYTITSYKDDLEIYNKYLILNGLDYKSIEYSDIRYYLKYLKEQRGEKILLFVEI